MTEKRKGITFDFYIDFSHRMKELKEWNYIILVVYNFLNLTPD